MTVAMDSAPQRSSLVDDTEVALRAWLGTGSHRPGDRLPPELELAGMLGVSRGTLRTALDRLEEAGEITRRQGSGTYVGQAVRPTAFREGLEVLRPYSQLAARRGVRLSARDLEIAEQRIGAEAAAAFGLTPDTEAWTVTRTILADGEPVAIMRDIVRPGVGLPPERRLRLVSARERAGRALDVQGATAVLELEEVMHLGSGEAVQHSSDLFAPGGIDLQVRRNLEVTAPAPLVRALGRT
jgi:DNA-binding GntR family transcriptional regulator